jgi:hypothetical protein
MGLKAMVFVALTIMMAILASGTLAPSIHVLQSRSIIVDFSSQDGLNFNAANAQTLEKNGLLEIHPLQTVVSQGKGESPILLLKNNFLEIIEVDAQVSNAYLDGLSVIRLTLMPGEEGQLVLTYDTTAAPTGAYSLVLLIDITSPYAHVNILRTVPLEVSMG